MIKNRIRNNIIRKYMNEFLDLGDLHIESIKENRPGKKKRKYILNESQELLLLMLIGNTENTVKYKTEYVKKIIKKESKE